MGISNRLLTPCHTRLRRPPRGPFSYQGVSTQGVRHRTSKPLFFFQQDTNRENKNGVFVKGGGVQNNRKGGTASLRSRTRVKRNALSGARFKGLSLYFLYQEGNLIRIKTGLDTHSRDTFWTLRSPGPEGPRGHPVGHSLGHPPFLGTLSGILREHFGPRDSCSRPAGSQNGGGGLCPLPKTAGFDENGENDEWPFRPQKQGLCSSDP